MVFRLMFASLGAVLAVSLTRGQCAVAASLERAASGSGALLRLAPLGHPGGLSASLESGLSAVVAALAPGLVCLLLVTAAVAARRAALLAAGLATVAAAVCFPSVATSIFVVCLVGLIASAAVAVRVSIAVGCALAGWLAAGTLAAAWHHHDLAVHTLASAVPGTDMAQLRFVGALLVMVLPFAAALGALLRGRATSKS